VLLSSHLLTEVEIIADEMILIGHGRIVAQGDKKTLLSTQKVATLVTSLDNARLGQVLTERGIPVVAAGDGLQVDAAPVEVGRAAAEHSIVLTDLRTGGAGLEDLFLELTSDTQRDELPQGASA
jgi:ABC-2 type transport system ATP-binding protein